MADNLPYLIAPGTLNTVLQKIKAAATPDRFTQDFLSNTLGMKGGSPKPLLPFLKRIGFLASDGSPTDLYRAFRNASQSGAAVAQATRIGYKPLFDMNESVHSVGDSELKGLIVQATGAEEDSRAVQLTAQTFKILKKNATFGSTMIQAQPRGQQSETRDEAPHDEREGDIGINLAYTINLNLPATPDIAVFNAIFKALKENLLKR